MDLIRERRSYSVLSIVYSIFWPFASLIYSLKQWRRPWAMNMFWIVCMYMGFIQIFHPEGTILGTGSDGGRYVLELMNMHLSTDSFSNISSDFYDGITLDLYCKTLTFIISRFTNNGHIFFFVVSAIFGYFYSRNVWYTLNRLPNRLRKGGWVLIALLFLICPIWNINGVRMWTAVHVFVYGAMPYLVEGNKRKLGWCLASILIHHSFFFPILLLTLYYILSKQFSHNNYILTCLFIFYILSLTVKQLDLSVLRNILNSYLPDYYEGRITGYVNEDVLLRKLTETSLNSWHVAFFSNLQHWILQLFVVFSYFTIKRNKKKQVWILPLFSFALLIYGLSNILSCVPSGSRYIILSKMFMVPVFLYVVSYFPLGKYFKRMLPYMLTILGISLIFDIRKGLDFYGYMLPIGNYLLAFLVESNVPLIQYIKFL